MKKLILLLSLIFAPVLNAHTFAHQEWYNPKTGQILEEYYDVHRTDNSDISPTTQRHALIERAKNSNALVITEDKPSLHFGGINYDDTSETNKQTIKQCIQDYPLDCSLAWSQAECFINDIPAFNAECRELNPTKPLKACYEQEVATYNDGNILNNFYKNLKQHAEELAGVNQRDYAFNYKCLIVDARALHALYNAQNNTIILTMGATHIIRINRLLLQLGWQPRTVTVPTAFDELQTATLTTALTPDVDSLHNTLDAWSSYLNSHVDNITTHEIDINAVKLSKMCTPDSNQHVPFSPLQKHIVAMNTWFSSLLTNA